MKKKFLILTIVMAGILLLFLFWEARMSNYWEKPIKIENFKKELYDFPVFRQQTDHTCGPASVRMVLKYFGKDISEKDIAKKCRTFFFGTLHWTFASGYRYYIEQIGKRSEMIEDISYEEIKKSLERENPVIFLFATIDEFHPPKQTLHFAVIIGIDEVEKKVTIANPFGRIEKMDILEWWDRFSLHPRYTAKMYRAFVKLGLLKPRTAFVILEEGK